MMNVRGRRILIMLLGAVYLALLYKFAIQFCPLRKSMKTSSPQTLFKFQYPLQSVSRRISATHSLPRQISTIAEYIMLTHEENLEVGPDDTTRTSHISTVDSARKKHMDVTRKFVGSVSMHKRRADTLVQGRRETLHSSRIGRDLNLGNVNPTSRNLTVSKHQHHLHTNGMKAENSTRMESNKTLIVVQRRPWFVHSTHVDFSSCGSDLSGECTLTYDLSNLPRARAVIFDALGLHRLSLTPPPRSPGQLWVLFFMEPPPVLFHQDPSFASREWKGVFNLTMSYRVDSDIFSPYGIVLPKERVGDIDFLLTRRNLPFDGSLKSERKYRGDETDGVSRNSKTGHFPVNDSKHRLQSDSQPIGGEFQFTSQLKVEQGNQKAFFPPKRGGYQVTPQLNVNQENQNPPLPNIQQENEESFRKPNLYNVHSHDSFSSRVAPLPKPYFLQVAAQKTRGVLWLVSHCGADSSRDQYVERLQRRMDVAIYGKCSGRKCGNTDECRALMNSTFRFVLSFENNFCTDYLTEKVFSLYHDLNVIPVVRGGADYSAQLPQGTYIDTSDFPSPEALGDYLKEISQDYVTYAVMLERKHRYTSVGWSWSWPFPWCQLCRLLQNHSQLTPGTLVYPDIAGWISDNKCWPAPDL